MPGYGLDSIFAKEGMQNVHRPMCNFVQSQLRVIKSALSGDGLFLNTDVEQGKLELKLQEHKASTLNDHGIDVNGVLLTMTGKDHWINHSCIPNCKFQKTEETHDVAIVTKVKCWVGTELTVN